MIDIETGDIVDLLESRELEDVEKWLKKFKNIEVVSRDGSTTYNAATTATHPNAIQISDRFHILKNLTEYGKDYLKRLLKNKVELGVVTVTKTKEVKLTKAEQKQEDLKDRKWKLIQEVQKAYKECQNFRKVSRDFGIDRKTVKGYISLKEPPAHGSKGIEKSSILDDYKELIIAMNNDNKKSKIIYNEIKEYGYFGSESLLRHYLSKLKKHHITQIVDKETINRNTLVSLLYKELDSVKNITKEMYDKFSKLYPEANKIYEIVKSFKEIVFSKKTERLDDWITKNKARNITEINSFINGIERDINAVKNAIKYDYNNGLAEGTVNKIKVVKRIMYGRCSFGLLKQKLLLLQH